MCVLPTHKLIQSAQSYPVSVLDILLWKMLILHRGRDNDELTSSSLNKYQPRVNLS